MRESKQYSMNTNQGTKRKLSYLLITLALIPFSYAGTQTVFTGEYCNDGRHMNLLLAEESVVGGSSFDGVFIEFFINGDVIGDNYVSVYPGGRYFASDVWVNGNELGMINAQALPTNAVRDSSLIRRGVGEFGAETLQRGANSVYFNVISLSEEPVEYSFAVAALYCSDEEQFTDVPEFGSLAVFTTAGVIALIALLRRRKRGEKE